jgi:hypothetical protein
MGRSGAAEMIDRLDTLGDLSRDDRGLPSFVPRLRAQGMALQWAMLVPAMVGAALVTALEWRFPHRRA